MATQTVTISRAPSNGNSQSSGLPAAPGAIDYSMTDLDLLETPDAPADEAAREGDAAEKGTDESAAESKDAAGTQSHEENAPGLKAPATSEFERAFELPDIGPKLREICERETQYQQLFPTVADARAVREIFADAGAARSAAAAQADLARLDRMVESRDPRAHAELLSGLQRLSPQAFRDLALTFGERLAELDPEAHQQVSAAMAAQALAGHRWPEHVALLSRAVEQQDWPAVKFLAATLSSNLAHVTPDAIRSAVGASRSSGTVPLRTPTTTETPNAGAVQTAAGQLLQSVNAEVEQAVQQSVARKVEELLPDAPEGARQKISGEIFRELDQTLRQDPELLDQVRESIRGALRSGPQSDPHRGTAERVAQLIAGRARAALPGVAKRVVADWSETVLRSTQARRSRQSESASRVEVGRGGAPGPVPLRPRGVDYARMSDAEILNMD